MTIHVKKIAQLHDERADAYYDVYQTDAVGGGHVRVEVPRGIREAGNVRKHLLSKGANLPDLEHCRGVLDDVVQVDAPVIRRAARAGWRGTGASFVDYRYVAGLDNGSVLPPLPTASTADLDVRGTLVEWQELIDCARHSTPMMISLCAAFEAPLLKHIHGQNFALVLVGPSRCGKTSAQLVGASVFGFGTEEYLPTPNATSAGLIEAATMFNDHMLPINELGAAPGRKQDKYAAVYEMTYALVSGKDKMRHSSFTSGTAMAGTSKIVVVMSSEFSPDDWAARADDGRDPGETARLIAVPVLYDGCPTVFHSTPRPPRAADAWIRDQLARLHEGLPNQRGTAFKAYLDALTANLDTFVKTAVADVAAFCKALEKHATTAIARDIIVKFSTLYAGGMAASDAKVLRFDQKTIWHAVRRACLAALRALPDPEAELHHDLATLKVLLGGGGVIDADEASTRQKQHMEQVDGFYEKSSPGRLYVMRSATIMKAFPSEPRARRIVEWLDDEGNLRHQRDRKPGVSTEWAQTHKMWPNGQRVRSFVLFFPNNLDILDHT